MLNFNLSSLNAEIVRGEEEYVNRVLDMELLPDEFRLLQRNNVNFIGVSDQFKDVIQTFPVNEGETPAGFRRELLIEKDGLVKVDLVRDISYDVNGIPRPTNVLFSADSANPYEVKPISRLIANLTCNPGIVYDLFINNPKANIGNVYKNRDEVMTELAKILGPGCDVSVELNNPFEDDFSKLLEEAEKFKEIFSKHRIVIKVPHTGAVTPENVQQLLSGDKTLDKRYDEIETKEAFRGHNLALKLHEHGYRVNFTLMFEPYQTQLALQARPYFINTFLRHRYMQSGRISDYVKMFEATGSQEVIDLLKAYLIKNDFLKVIDDLSSGEIYNLAKHLINYRLFNEAEGADGLDGMRHNLRVLKNCNLKESRLIVCSMEGEDNYPAIDKLLAEPEFTDMHRKVVITAEPQYLARFTSTNQVTSYQRRFMNAANGQK
ncbi:MAG: transaldolase family protein [Lachnospiraceae bacterium]